ncbi:hypothetical protein LHA31_04000 [Carnobacterium viridans]|uniref:Zinc-binding metallo-peptidase n=1 Tax=Carnobacterium viridans TaxID=174587 RepID=A0A1H1B4E3_9LACT|nr:hypothetical protein [Carnobacterium viridans]UDE95933.1 hypothetical protein LHA31_04000 [Carnobacterium viridans]SDQ46805.1 hypothetical protein SAMN04487752_2419 [Carnobacterium viridans]
MQRILFLIFTSSLLFLSYFSYEIITMPGFIDDTVEKSSSEGTIEEGDGYLDEIKELIGDPLDFKSGAPTKAGTNIEQSQSALIQKSTIVTYQVTNDVLSNGIINTANTNQTEYARDTNDHHRLWDTFKTIIPADLRTNVYSFSVFSDGISNLLGYVEPLDYNGDTWQLGVDFIDSIDKKNFYYTLIHEYGHLLTLNNKQLVSNYDWKTFDQKETTYSSFYGESTPDSYMNVYYQEFWIYYYKEWQHLNVQSDSKAQQAFYLEHADDFLTSYAVTHPEEDIAESWTFFILSPKQSNDTVAQKKQNFFYQFPELVETRTEILKNLLTEAKKD